MIVTKRKFNQLQKRLDDIDARLKQMECKHDQGARRIWNMNFILIPKRKISQLPNI